MICMGSKQGVIKHGITVNNGICQHVRITHTNTPENICVALDLCTVQYDLAHCVYTSRMVLQLGRITGKVDRRLTDILICVDNEGGARDNDIGAVYLNY